MSQYKITKQKDPKEIYEIIEIENNLILYKSKNYDKAKVYYELLKKGSAFQGFTPPFFALKLCQ